MSDADLDRELPRRHHARYRLTPDRDLRTESGGQLLMGGHPFRMIRLSAVGAARVASWFNGASPATPADHDLADRLVDAGLAHPIPVADRSQPMGRAMPHVVIPFRGSQADIESTVATLRPQLPASITIVDDGSNPAVTAIEGATVLRQDESTGPAAARNVGWRHVVAEHGDGAIIAFVDGGIRFGGDADDLGRLVDHFHSDSVAAVAPRIASEPGQSTIGRYEQRFSPLDLGAEPSLVGVGRRVTYVPTATLLVSAAALIAANGFDEELRYGEDVDLVWRLSETSQVRYDPSVIVQHRPRATLGAFARQRFLYATAAAALDRRHPSASAPWTATPYGVAGVLVVSLGHPVLGVLSGFAMTPRLAQQLSSTATPTATGVRLSGLAHYWALRSFAEGMSRTWVTLATIVSPLAGRRALGWMIAGWLRRLGETQAPDELALGVLDDVAYGMGAAVGAVRHRSVRSLLPRFSFPS